MEDYIQDVPGEVEIIYKDKSKDFHSFKSAKILSLILILFRGNDRDIVIPLNNIHKFIFREIFND